MTRDACLDLLSDLLRADQRALGCWLAGSLGRGDGDEWSDLDLLVAVDPTSQNAFVAHFESQVTVRADIVLGKRLELGTATVLSYVTDEWVRFDVSVVPPSDLARRDASGLRRIFDREGLHPTAGAALPPVGPSGARVAELTREFLRVLGLLPVVLGREELEVGASGAALVRTLLIELMVEASDVADRGGALSLRRLLPPEQLVALRRLPPIVATGESITAVHLACANEFLPLARELSERTNVPWPHALESALRRHLLSQLGVRLAG